MTTFVCRRGRENSIADFARNWHPASTLKIAHYGDDIEDDVLIFADVDILTADERRFAVALEAEQTYRGGRLLNSPSKTLSRVGLLRLLHRQGRNDFDVHAVDVNVDGVRYPCFLRHAVEHTGARSALLRSPAALTAALTKAAAGTIVVEYVDVSDDAGVFRKYSATRVGDVVLPHHVFFSKQWEVKARSLLPYTADRIAEEIAYQHSTDHLAEVTEVFVLAGMQYGRMDYGFLNGRIQVWEINSNPTLLKPKSYYLPEQLSDKRSFAARLGASFDNL